MISIQKEIATGQVLQRLLDQVILNYQGTVQDARRSAVDLGPLTAPYQASLDVVLQAMAQPDWTEMQVASFREELQAAFRSFKQKADQQFSRLKNDLEQTSTSLLAVLKTLEYEEPALSLRAQVTKLDELQKIDEIQQLKAALQLASCEFEKSLNEIEKRDHLVISDLQAEITTLHNRVAVLSVQDGETRSLRMILDERLSGEAFSLLLVRLSGLGRLKAAHGEACATAVMDEARNRLKKAISEMQAIGLWDEQTFGAVIPAGAGSAVLTQAANTALSGKYEFSEKAVTLHASAGVLAWRPPEERARFLRKLQDLAQVLPG
jgi:GGDEF domain-containing protein